MNVLLFGTLVTQGGRLVLGLRPSVALVRQPSAAELVLFSLLFFIFYVLMCSIVFWYSIIIRVLTGVNKASKNIIYILTCFLYRLWWYFWNRVVIIGCQHIKHSCDFFWRFNNCPYWVTMSELGDLVLW